MNIAKVNCRICKADSLDLLHDFGMMPVAGYLVDSFQKAIDENRYSNFLVRCSKCGLVQQGGGDFYNVLIDKVYSNYQATYSMSLKVREYMSKFIDDAMEVSEIKSKEDIVLEIGSNDGSMFDILREKGVRPAGIDPSAVASDKDKDAIVMRDFFSTAVAQKFVNEHGKVKLLFSRHTLEHVFDPGDFMNAIGLILDSQGVAVIEVPYLAAQLNANQYPGMTFQHISFFTLQCLKYLGELYGLHMFNVKPSKMDGGSVVVYLAKNPRANVTHTLFGLLEYEKDSETACLQGLLKKFQLIETSKKHVREHIMGLSKNSFGVLSYGAGSKGQALLNMLNLSSDIVPFVVDDTPGTKGRYIPGTGTKVIDSADENMLKSNFCLITAPTHVDEIAAKEQKKHPQVTFIRTSPDFSYISSI